MSFYSDLNFGKTWEAVAQRLVGGAITPSPDGIFKPYDFISEGIKYEVKADRLAFKYGGNTMFIEYECNGSPSGISTTEADYWIYFMVSPSGTFKCFQIPVADLRAACVGCPVKSGGDGYRSRGYIVSTGGFKMCLLETTLSVRDVLSIRHPPSSPPVPRGSMTPGSRSPETGQATPV